MSQSDMFLKPKWRLEIGWSSPANGREAAAKLLFTAGSGNCSSRDNVESLSLRLVSHFFAIRDTGATLDGDPDTPTKSLANGFYQKSCLQRKSRLTCTMYSIFPFKKVSEFH